MNLGCYH